MTPAVLRRKLARDFPIRRRVVVLFEECDEPGTMGECWLEERTIYIVIAPSGRDEQCEALVHEWAHARIFDQDNKLSPRHTNRWALEYAKIYRRYWDVI